MIIPAPSPSPDPTPSPTKTPLSTSTPVVPITTAPILDVQMMLVPPVDVVMEGESPISVQLGEVGTLCLGTNYPGSAVAQGFALRTEDATVKTTALVVNGTLDVEVMSDQETSLAVPTERFEKISGQFENPFVVAREFLDFGVRVELP